MQQNISFKTIRIKIKEYCLFLFGLFDCMNNSVYRMMTGSSFWDLVAYLVQKSLLNFLQDMKLDSLIVYLTNDYTIYVPKTLKRPTQ